MSKVLVVGIGGVTGGGKTSLCALLNQRYPGSVHTFHMDDYFRPEGSPQHRHLPNSTDIDWDCVESVDFDRLLGDLEQLLGELEKTVECESDNNECAIMVDIDGGVVRTNSAGSELEDIGSGTKPQNMGIRESKQTNEDEGDACFNGSYEHSTAASKTVASTSNPAHTVSVVNSALPNQSLIEVDNSVVNTLNITHSAIPNQSLVKVDNPISTVNLRYPTVSNPSLIKVDNSSSILNMAHPALPNPSLSKVDKTYVTLNPVNAPDGQTVEKLQTMYIKKENLKRLESPLPDLVLVEGILIYEYAPLQPFFSRRYFLTLNQTVARDRRLRRHYGDNADGEEYFEMCVWPSYLACLGRVLPGALLRELETYSEHSNLVNSVLDNQVNVVPENRVNSAHENQVNCAPGNRVNSTTDNQVNVVPENWVNFAPDNRVNFTLNNQVNSILEDRVNSAPDNRINSEHTGNEVNAATQNCVSSALGNYANSAPINRVKSAPENRLDSEPSNQDDCERLNRFDSPALSTSIVSDARPVNSISELKAYLKGCELLESDKNVVELNGTTPLDVNCDIILADISRLIGCRE